MTPKGEIPRDNYLDPISNQCPPGASIDKNVESFPIDFYPESAQGKNNGNTAISHQRALYAIQTRPLVRDCVTLLIFKLLIKLFTFSRKFF